MFGRRLSSIWAGTGGREEEESAALFRVFAPALASQFPGLRSGRRQSFAVRSHRARPLQRIVLFEAKAMGSLGVSTSARVHPLVRFDNFLYFSLHGPRQYSLPCCYQFHIC